MIIFKVSVPGKINLFGENLTCNDHNGVMASIDRRTTIKFNEFPSSMPVIKLDFLEIKMHCMIHLRQFQKFYKECTFDDTLCQQIIQFIFTVNEWNCHREMLLIGHTLFYLLVYVTYKEEIDIEDMTPFQVFIETQLSGANFGGLASIVVGFTTCLLHWSNLRRNANHELNDNDRAKISMYSKNCDEFFNYCMFQSEVTVSTYGSMLRYRCRDSSQNELVLDNMPKMRVLMVASTIGLVKRQEIKTKANLINYHPHIASSILNSIRVISDTAFSVLKKIRDMNKEAVTYSQDVSAQEKKLFTLISMQQELNKIFINFSEQMNTICRIARRHQLSGKCSDFIYASNAYIWWPSDSSAQDEYRIRMDLISKGFVSEFIDLNCDGVRIE